MKKTVMSKVMGVAMSTIMAAAMLAGCGSAINYKFTER